MSFEGDIDRAIQSLVSVEHASYGSLINTPLLYPSGSSVVIQVTGSGDAMFVTDMGLGFGEAEMMGAPSRLFTEQAAPLAAAYGIGFDSQAFFVAKARRDQLSGAVKAVANCSLSAVHAASYRLADKPSEDDAAFLYERLVSVFGTKRVTRNARVPGVSTHPWPIKARVDTGQSVSLFEFASHHYASVVSVAAKFNDIARIEAAPKLVTVVRSKLALGDFLGVLSQASSVVEAGATNETFERLAA